METAFSFLSPFNWHNERAMPDRRVGMQRQFQAVYGSTTPTEFLLVTLQNARPRGRSPFSDWKQSLTGQRGITRRASRLIPGEDGK